MSIFGGVAGVDMASFKASSSIGRAAVSKTAGWGFKSLLACGDADVGEAAHERGGCWTVSALSCKVVAHVG